jgi:hypothetical protein
MAKKEELVRFSGTLPKSLFEQLKTQSILEQRSRNVIFNNAIIWYLKTFYQKYDSSINIRDIEDIRDNE